MDPVLVLFARTELPLLTDGVVGIVGAKLAETRLGRTRERDSPGEGAPELVLAV